MEKESKNEGIPDVKKGEGGKEILEISKERYAGERKGMDVACE